MKKKTSFIILFLSAFLQLKAQYNTNLNKIWAFGANAGVDFTSGSPVSFTSSINNSEGCATVCSSTGSLLFYTDGETVFNRIGAIMPSGASIVPFFAGSSTQAALIVPSLSNPNQYYLFTTEDNSTTTGSLSYSIVDMSLAGGFGDLLPGFIGVPIATGRAEKLASVTSDRCSIWVLTHSNNTGKFFAYEITVAGLSTTPVISTVGSFSGVNAYEIGVMKVSPDRRKIVCNSYTFPPSFSPPPGCELYDFDPATGIVSNLQILNSVDAYYGAEFSPDNTKLYSMNEGPAGLAGTLEQYDITLPTTAAIIASKVIIKTYGGSLGGDLKLGPDAKIYTPLVSSGFLDCITSPNLAGLACSYVSSAVNLFPNSAIFGLPNVVMSTPPPDTSFVKHDTTACVPPATGITIRPHTTGTGYFWYDGATTVTHLVMAPGAYWVITKNGCSIDVDTIVVHGKTSDAPPVISGKPSYCFGDPYIPLTAAGAGILWYTSVPGTGSSTPPPVNTNTPGTFTIYASQTITCEGGLDSFKVIVKPRINPNFTFSTHLSCNGGRVDFTNTTTNAYGCLWDFGDGSVVNDHSNTTTSHTYTLQGTYQVKITADSGVCFRDTTISVSLFHTLNADFAAIKDTICAGETTTLTDMSTPALSFSAYLWWLGDGSTDVTLGSPTHLYPVPGEYPVKMVVTDTLGCMDSVTKNVYVLGVTINSFRDTTLCVAQPFALTNEVSLNPNLALGDSMYTYQWFPSNNLSATDVHIPFYMGIGLTTYTVIATLKAPYNCIAMDTLRIHSVPGVPLANVTPDQTIAYGSSIALNADSEVYYLWKPDDRSLSNANINNPTAKPEVTTLYTVYGYDINGCIDSAFVKISVDDNMEECIPSAFTPNSDGRNDIFRPACQKFQALVDFRVFNRWGAQVFYSNSFKNGWNGTLDGEPLDMGVYYYVITVARPGESGDNIIYKGDVTLIR